MVAAGAGLVDFSSSGWKVTTLRLGPAPDSVWLSPDGELDTNRIRFLPPGQGFTATKAEFYALDGTDLLVWEDRLYAVDDSRQATLLLGSVATEREKMTGVVRKMADTLSEKGATKAKLTKAEFEQGKLQAQVQIKGRTKEILTFGAE